MRFGHERGRDENAARQVPKWQRIERSEQSKIETPRKTPAEAATPGFRGEMIPEREEKFCHVK